MVPPVPDTAVECLCICPPTAGSRLALGGGVSSRGRSDGDDAGDGGRGRGDGADDDGDGARGDDARGADLQR